MSPKRICAWILGIVGGLLVAAGIFLMLPKQNENIEVLADDEPVSPRTATDGVFELVVDISGAVNKPGVYHFSYGQRVVDALEAAGGLSADANIAWVDKNLNKSEKLKDGIKLYIPTKDEATRTGNDVSGVLVVNVNTASESQLESLSAIGPATAGKIISGRPYSRIEEIVEKKIVSQKVFDQIKQQLGI